jgi:Family of unknown function (DUF6600)/FecR protein
MRPRIPILTGLVLAGAAFAAAQAQDDYQDGRIRFVEPGVTLQRATEVAAEEAIANLPFLPGDRVWTDGTGRAEFQFPEGSVVRLDSGSKLDYAGHDKGKEERVVLRLWSGSVILRERTPELARIEVETPSGIARVLDPGLVRIDVAGGETRLSVYEGQAAFDDGQGEVRLAAGERTWARWGERAAEPERFDLAEGDAFAEWDAQRDSEERAAAASPYLPPELDAYSDEFQRNGSWRYEGSVGYVWAPYVTAAWQPYSNGNWEWTPYGWTWIPYESWGWVPSHYGRWGYSVSFGWYWVPGRTWGPAWVSWGIGGGYVSWCPLGRSNRPVTGWRGGYEAGHAVSRSGQARGWTVVRRDALGRRDIARQRVGVDAAALSAMHIADSASLRPTRDGQSLREGGPIPGRHKLTPGDFVRELAVDNKTTIPAPWLREGEARGEVGRAYSRRESATQPTEATRRNGGSPAATAQEGGAAPSASPRTNRPVSPSTGTPASPWTGRQARPSGESRPATPPAGAGRRTPSNGSGSASASRQKPESQQRAERRQPESAPRPRREEAASPSGRSSASRPRAQGSSSGSSGARPRTESRPRSDGAARPQAAAGRPKSSGGGGAPSGQKATQRSPRPKK